jgi:hypothetical protein
VKDIGGLIVECGERYGPSGHCTSITLDLGPFAKEAVRNLVLSLPENLS